MIAGLLIAALAVAQEPVAEGVRVEHAATGASLAVDVARPASAGGVGERAVARLPGRVPLVAHGDRVRWDLATGQVELTGDVRIERGELVLLCQHLVLDWEGEALTRAVASGALQAHLGERSATATEASLDPEAGLIVLTGAPRLQWGDRVLEGDRIALALEDERVDCDHCRLVLEDPR